MDTLIHPIFWEHRAAQLTFCPAAKTTNSGMCLSEGVCGPRRLWHKRIQGSLRSLLGECWLQQHMAKEGYFSPCVRLVEGVHMQQHAAVAAVVWGGERQTSTVRSLCTILNRKLKQKCSFNHQCSWFQSLACCLQNVCNLTLGDFLECNQRQGRSSPRPASSH